MLGQPEDPNFNSGGLTTEGKQMAQPMQPLPYAHLNAPDAHKLLAPNPQLQKVLFTRLEALNQDDATAFRDMVTPQVASVLGKVVPEITPILQRFAEINSSQGNDTGCDDSGNQQGSPDLGADASQQGCNAPPNCVQASSSPQGFAKGGPVSLAEHFGFTKAGAGDLNRNGYVNKGIPSSSLARGGIAAPPKPMALERPMSPASTKFSSRVYNNPKYAAGGLMGAAPTAVQSTPQQPVQQQAPTQPQQQFHVPAVMGNRPNGFMGQPQNRPAPHSMGGSSRLGIMGYADGGAAQGAPQGDPSQQQSAGPTGNPDTDQAIQNQKIAEQVVPKDGTSDSVDAKLSKGEFVMDAATVMFYGMGKLTQMQETAHEKIAQHIGKQDAQQQDQQSQQQGQQQPPQAAQQQQAQQQKMAMMSPPPQMPSSNPPNATEQRIQQTNSPRAGNPYSLG